MRRQRRPEELAQPLRRHRHLAALLVRLAILDLLARALARDARDLPLEIAQPGLARVVVDDEAQGRVRELERLVVEAGGGELARQHVAARDLELLLFGVAGEADDLHAIAERLGDRIGGVGGGDEQHLRQVVGDAEVVIAEGGVLLGIEHLEQRRRRVAAEIGAQLVDLVEDEHRIDGARLLHALNHAPRHGADIGAAVAADLGLVANAAERHAHELAPERARDRSPERGLADPGRADEAQDRPLLDAAALARQLEHAEVLEDAIFDVLEAVVILVEDLARLGQIQFVVGGGDPRDLDQPLEVGAQDARLGRVGVGLLEPAQLTIGLGARFGRHARGLDLAAQRLEIALAAGAAQLRLDLAQLLAQEVFALRLGHLLLGARLNRRLHLEDLDLFLQERADAAQALERIHLLEQRLANRDLHGHVRRDQVGEAPRILDAGDDHHELGRLQLAALRILGEVVAHRAHERLGLGARRRRELLDALDRDRETGRLLHEAGDARTHQALHQHLDAPVGELAHAHDHADGPEGVDGLGRRILLALIALRAEQHQPVLGRQRLVDGGDRHLARHHERHDHVRKDHEIANRQQRQRRRDLQRLLDGAVG